MVSSPVILTEHATMRQAITTHGRSGRVADSGRNHRTEALENALIVKLVTQSDCAQIRDEIPVADEIDGVA
jgi:hypothetical protein